MVARKRGHEEIDASEHASTPPTLLERLRSTWEFANLMQYIYIFGKAVKIDENLDIEDLERECCMLEPSKVLSDIGLALLKYVSSHRGLTPEIFDEYTRRQYVAKAPQRNPFGEDEEPKHFVDFDVFTKLKVLVQLSQWTLNNAERIREKMDERGENEQSMAWRINEIGYDRHDRYYFVLDDNRLYRRTEPPLSSPPDPKPKVKSKKAKAAARASKRRKIREAEESANDADIETPQPDDDTQDTEHRESADGFGGRTWECVAISMSEYQVFLSSIEKSRDADEKALYKTITGDVMPIIEQAEASQLRKKQKQEREVVNMHKLATAKRSSRLEAKTEKERQEREAVETEQKRKEGIAEAEAYQRRQERMEQDRESRMLTREQRLKEREMKRILNEQDLARMSEEEKKVDAGESRMSERHLKVEMEKKKKELAALEEFDEWTFDCSKCGQHGPNWVRLLRPFYGISQAEAERDDFRFVCLDCTRREEDAKRPKIPSLKFRLGHSLSPPDQKPKVAIPQPAQVRKPNLAADDGQSQDAKRLKQLESADPVFLGPSASPLNSTTNGIHKPVMNGYTTNRQALSTDKQKSPRVPAPIQPYPPKFARPSPPNQYNHSHNGLNGVKGPAPNQSFQPPPFLTNGYRPATHTPRPNSYQAYQSYAIPQNTFQPSATTQQSQQQPGWSPQYVPPRPQQISPSSHIQAPPGPSSPSKPPDQTRPPPSHNMPSVQAQSHSLPSPLQNAPSLSPPQYKTPNQSFNYSALSSTPPQLDGTVPNNTGVYEPVGPPSQSPVKQASPPAVQPVKATPLSSSPIGHQPALRPNGPVSPGYSPVKNASPQQRPLPPSHGVPLEASALVLATKLAPSPLQQHVGGELRSSISLPENIEAHRPEQQMD
ncbi:uncharacterized protein KY384_002111 [Bacidia gigantensis]|uniref:uncharacterized protein n=1 Tax=Bacidia gigantensis TaxID=2732470 RepID=UPI001D0589C9|nr:uncharacterized protein KY384_002111 [Bacidia gigantensis]KAG8533328.1 hypothetical protein KY384_002111 [Bacidia gigantensis]